MKATRDELKSIVKECLLEILSEGIGGSPRQQRITRSDLSSNIQTRPSVPQQPRIPTRNLKEAIRREAGGNDVLASILADTATSTLPKMLQSEGRRTAPAPGGLVEQVVAEASPEELFGDEVASKWAELAFMGNSPKK